MVGGDIVGNGDGVVVVGSVVMVGGMMCLITANSVD